METPSRPVPLWAGRTLALFGILLVAANLRTAVTAVSPIVAEISVDVPLNTIFLGVIGMLPPVCFAVFGLLTPSIARRFGLELTTIVAFAAMIAGNALRSVSAGYELFLVGSMLAFAGMGVGNVLLPALAKRYFPDRIGLLTTCYATILSLSTFIPPLIAGPVAESAGWRVSLGMWAALAFIGMLPWLVVLRGSRRASVTLELEPAPPLATVRLWRSKVAWAILTIFAVSGISAYAMFAWLPQLLIDTAGVSALAAGALLSLYGLMGLPAGLLVPGLASRMQNVSSLVYLSAVFFVVGDLGLLLAPATLTWLWVAFAGLGQIMFPLSFVLISLRTRSHEMAAALSGFVQGIGYGVGALGPLVFSLLKFSTGSWTLSLVLLIVVSALSALAALPLRKPTMVEDELPVTTDERSGSLPSLPPLPPGQRDEQQPGHR